MNTGRLLVDTSGEPVLPGTPVLRRADRTDALQSSSG